MPVDTTMIAVKWATVLINEWMTIVAIEFTAKELMQKLILYGSSWRSVHEQIESTLPSYKAFLSQEN